MEFFSGGDVMGTMFVGVKLRVMKFLIVVPFPILMTSIMHQGGGVGNLSFGCCVGIDRVLELDLFTAGSKNTSPTTLCGCNRWG
jgi:hypothetical protein